MKYFVTPPIKHLELSELGNGGFYILAQLYKKYPEYRDYVSKMKAAGRFLILDNGAGDEGEVICKEELFELTQEIKPNEVIPTDTLYDMTRTMADLIWFMTKVKSDPSLIGTKIFACPQASTLSEYITFVSVLNEIDEISTIGLSKKTIPYIYGVKEKDQAIDLTRMTFVYHLNSILGIKKQFHCLGMGDCREFNAYAKLSFMRSTDSCYPILAAINGIDLRNDRFVRVPTPEDYFELEMSPTQIKLAEKNIEFLAECCSSLQ